MTTSRLINLPAYDSADLYVSTTAVGNIGAGEDDLMSYTLPAGTLGGNGQRILFRASGITANTANSKTLKVYFGGTQIFSTAAFTTSAAKNWVVTGEIIRIASGSQTCNVTIESDDAGIVALATITATSIDLTASAILKLTATATADNDLVEKSLSVCLGGGGPSAAGTSNPSSPSTNQRFFRTDLGLDIYYDGTQWLTMNVYEQVLSIFSNSITGGFDYYTPARTDYQMYATRWACKTYVSTTNNSTNRWTLTLNARDSALASTTIASVNTGATPDAASTAINHDQVINAAIPSGTLFLTMVIAKVGSPGSLICGNALFYRLIIT